MSDNIAEKQFEIESKANKHNNNNILDVICTFQECNASESLIILQAFLHLIPKQEYSNDFIQYQLNLLKRLSLSSSNSYIPSLFELLKRFIPTSELISSFNTIRQSIVESLITQFRKDTQKQKWGGNGEKIQSLGYTLEQSLKLYYSNEPLIQNTNHLWNSIVLNLFEPLIDELNEYLRSKVDKQQQQYLSLGHLIKPLAKVCQLLRQIDEKKDCMIINEYFSDIILANLHHRIDLILNKKMFDHFDSLDKFEQYTCPTRNSTFFVHPEIKKLLIFLDEARISKNSPNLIKKCNEELEKLIDKASHIFHRYPSSTSLQHCIFIISCLSSIEILFHYDRFQDFLYNFCQYILSYWQINLLQDCDANNWLSTKSYMDNIRYSVYVDSLFYQFNRLHLHLKRYCPNLLSIIIPSLLLELMNFIYHRYASIKVSYARQNQYKYDLLGFLVHSSQFSHYFIDNKNSTEEYLLFNNDNIESKFVEYGNRILSAIVLVTCPCELLYEHLENMTQRSSNISPKFNWLAIIRPDWFDNNYQIRSQVQTFLTLANIVATQQNNVPIDTLVTFVIDNFELDSYGSNTVHLIMQHERWDLIHLFVKHEDDWTFLNNLSNKLPQWLSRFMDYSEEYFAKCCSLCANEREIEWRLKIQQKLDFEQRDDEKLNYLNSLQHYIANLPLYVYHLLCAITQYHTQFSKQLIFARLLYNYMINHNINRASVYYSFLTGNEKDNHHQVERLLDRKSPLFRFPHGLLSNEQAKSRSTFNIFEILDENLDKIRLHFEIKNLDEYYSGSQTYTQLISQQQPFSQSNENLNLKILNDESSFTDLNMRGSKRSLHKIIQTFRIDSSLVNRIELKWPILFTHIVTQLKLNIIYHLITLRFEFQANFSSSLTDSERLTVEKLIALLTSSFNEKQ